MSRRATPTVLPLPLGHVQFINAYEAIGFAPDSAIDAYQSVYHCKRSSAGVGAGRLLADVRVQQEIALRLEATRVITPEALGACLLKYRRWAEDKQDYIAGASICMDQAKLAGFLVDKRQEMSPPPSLSEGQLADELRRRGFVPVPAN